MTSHASSRSLTNLPTTVAEPVCVTDNELLESCVITCLGSQDELRFFTVDSPGHVSTLTGPRTASTTRADLHLGEECCDRKPELVIRNDAAQSAPRQFSAYGTSDDIPERAGLPITDQAWSRTGFEAESRSVDPPVENCRGPDLPAGGDPSLIEDRDHTWFVEHHHRLARDPIIERDFPSDPLQRVDNRRGHPGPDCRHPRLRG